MSGDSEWKIRLALEKHLQKLLPLLSTKWEDGKMTSQSGIAYQEVELVFARPENPSMGDDFKRKQGYFKITVAYPPQDLGDATDRAEALARHFRRGTPLIEDDVYVIISETPEIGTSFKQDDRRKIPVYVRWFVNSLN